MGVYLLFAFFINICFAYSKFFIIFEHKKAIESLSASTGLALRNIGTDISPRRKYASFIGLLAIKNAIHEYKQDSKKEDFSDIEV